MADVFHVDGDQDGWDIGEDAWALCLKLPEHFPNSRALWKFKGNFCGIGPLPQDGKQFDLGTHEAVLFG